MNFEGKYALVTGGGTGIGAAVARALVERGAQVCIVGRRREALIDVQQRLGREGKRVRVFPGDVTRSDSRAELADAIRTETGRLDCVVHSAGTYLKAAIMEMEEEVWDRTFDANVKSIFLLSKLLLPLMTAEGGSIVTVASTLACRTAPGTAAYAASKAAVVSLTRSMAREFAGMNIRVNCICPGIVDTPVHDPFLKSEGERERFLAQVSGRVPLGRIGRPEDVAHAVLFLLSDEASWITGEVLAVDGGMAIL